jgi:hypothetical protein
MSEMNRQSVIMVAPGVVLGIIAAAAIALMDMPAMEFVLGALAAACVAVATWRAIIFVQGDAAASSPSLVTTQVHVVQADRRRPTFDRETGLLAEWYFRLRFDEEMARARRYGQPLTALAIAVKSPEAVDEARIASKEFLREVDFAGDLGEVIAVCLPNTPRAGAETVIERFTGLVRDVEIRIGEYPADGVTLAALLHEDLWRTSGASTDQSFAA